MAQYEITQDELRQALQDIADVFENMCEEDYKLLSESTQRRLAKASQHIYTILPSTLPEEKKPLLE